MKQKKVGVLVGHYGQATGATAGSRDEYSMCLSDADELVRSINRDCLLDAVLVSVDRSRHPWSLIQEVSRLSLPSFLGGAGNIDIRAAWAIHEEFDVAVELHLNRSTLNDVGLVRAAGHEVYVRRRPGPRTRRLGEIILEEMNLYLGNADRGLRHRSFRVLRKLHKANIPAALLEPAFLTEDRCVSRAWRAGYVGAVKSAIYRYFSIGG